MKHRTTADAPRAYIRALRNEQIAVSDLQRAVDEPASRQTIYRVLRQLEVHDWVGQNSEAWRPSYRTKALGDVDDREEKSGFDFSADNLL
jgi:DNA-binding IclR family transcriptional regulator